ncbi:MAG: Crp/Fnr family transcriptional regulator [Synechococcaceae cyanobacterium]|nr:Crp/Fnr family transcriptional regulator [Synechococcaceae cyanobacterium]
MAASGVLTTIRALGRDHGLRPFHEGDTFYRHGDPGDALYAVAEGTVRLRWNSGGGFEDIGPGGCFGLGALVHPEHTHHGTARALSDGSLLVMTRPAFLFALQELPMFALEIIDDLEQRLQRHKRALPR